MSQDLNWNEVALAIHDDNLTLHGKRVAILRDPSPETFGNSKILVPESSKVVKPLSGVIVAIGDKVTEEDSILDIGMRVNFNKFNVFEFDRDMVASEIGVNHESVAKWLTMWHTEGFIHFHKPTMIKPRIYTGVPMSVIDLERLDNRRARAWERLDIVKLWCMAPDDEKQDILKDYFSNWKS